VVICWSQQHCCMMSYYFKVSLLQNSVLKKMWVRIFLCFTINILWFLHQPHLTVWIFKHLTQLSAALYCEVMWYHAELLISMTTLYSCLVIACCMPSTYTEWTLFYVAITIIAILIHVFNSIPADTSPELRDLLQKLLQRNASDRIDFGLYQHYS